MSIRGEKVTLSSDDTFTLQIHGTRRNGNLNTRTETTPQDLVACFSRRTLLRLFRVGDANERHMLKLALALSIENA